MKKILRRLLLFPFVLFTSIVLFIPLYLAYEEDTLKDAFKNTCGVLRSVWEGK